MYIVNEFTTFPIFLLFLALAALVSDLLKKRAYKKNFPRLVYFPHEDTPNTERFSPYLATILKNICQGA